MSGLRFDHPTPAQRVLFGTGAAGESIAAALDGLGALHPAVVVSPSSAEAARSLLAGVDVALWWEEVPQHVPVEVAQRAREAVAGSGADALVCIGGGSSVGMAKAVALETSLPIVAVPTTYAGSEGTNVWGLTEDGTKRTGSDPRVLPRAVVYDAALSASLPLPLSVSSGLNALAHCVDSLWAPRADPLNGAQALEGARVLVEALEALREDEHSQAAGEQALLGGYLAAVAFASAGSGLHHKIAHVLGGTFGLPHAQTHAALLRYVVAFNMDAQPGLASRLARITGGDDALETLTGLYGRLGAPGSLAELGLTEANVPDAVERVLAAAPPGNPRAVTREGLEQLLLAALTGDDPSILRSELAAAPQATPDTNPRSAS